MIARKLCLGLALLVLSTLNAWAANANYSIVCAINPGTDINRVALSLQGRVIRQVLDDAYLLAVKNLPGNALPPGVQYCENNVKAPLPSFMGALVSANGNSGSTWYRSQPAMALVNVAKAQQIASGRGIIIAG